MYMQLRGIPELILNSDRIEYPTASRTSYPYVPAVLEQDRSCRQPPRSKCMIIPIVLDLRACSHVFTLQLVLD